MSAVRNTPQGGFTLIELVVVIVILGILAAFAIPRFANIAKDARVSAINGMAGSLRSTAALVHGMSLARNVVNDATGLIQLEGQNVDIVNSYPAASATGIEKAIVNIDTNTYSVTHAGGVTTIEISGAPAPATCVVTYTQAAVGGAGLVSTPVTTGC